MRHNCSSFLTYPVRGNSLPSRCSLLFMYRSWKQPQGRLLSSIWFPRANLACYERFCDGRDKQQKHPKKKERKPPMLSRMCKVQVSLADLLLLHHGARGTRINLKCFPTLLTFSFLHSPFVLFISLTNRTTNAVGNV